MYDGVAESMGMLDRLEYEATTIYIKRNGNYTLCPVSIPNVVDIVVTSG